MNHAVKETQTDVSPRGANGGLILDIEESQAKEDGVELGRLLAEVVEVVGGPLNEGGQLFCFLLLDGSRVEGDVVLAEGGNAAPVEKTFHGKSPCGEADDGAEERLA